LLNLLPRFFDPSSGAVLLEGVDLRDLRLEDLRAQVGLVLQKPIILPTTVAENIAYGKPHATMAEIEAAAHYANASAFIEKLPQQYQTAIGDGGARLSVGEKQRINLARAFLKDAPNLLMDEPTSALDVESEAQGVASPFALSLFGLALSGGVLELPSCPEPVAGLGHRGVDPCRLLEHVRRIRP